MHKQNIQTISKSLIVPIYKNEENIPSLLSALNSISINLGRDLEVVFVIDGSPDKSLDLLTILLPTMNFPAQIITHSRNFGSFIAIRTGMKYAKGKYFAVMAADLQEPPHLIEKFFKILGDDEADVIFGQRVERNDPPLNKCLSNLYWKFYRKAIQPDIPKGGVDIFACNKRVRDCIINIHESHSSLISQLFWIGFRRSFVPYTRQERKHGSSGWGFKKRVRYMVDSVFSYSDFPIRLILYIGFFCLFLTFLIGSITLFNRIFFTVTVPGYTTIILIVLFFGSMILITQGIIGCYLWLIFENSKKRPLSIIDKIQDFNQRSPAPDNNK